MQDITEPVYEYQYGYFSDGQWNLTDRYYTKDEMAIRSYYNNSTDRFEKHIICDASKRLRIV